jgi:gamma-glutamylcyclotransferase (GGCT)/AIG2-like uncharacterized protein YtfP
MTTYDPRPDDDLVALQIDAATAAAEHAELVRWGGYAEEDYIPADAECDLPYDPTEWVECPFRPFAVYGTLRPGCGADDLWAGLASLISPTPFLVHHYRLETHGAFPFAMLAEDRSSTIVVDLIVPRDAEAERILLDRFDRYEGVPRLYRRVEVAAYDPASPRAVRAWLYEPTNPGDHRPLTVIPSGDWKTYLADRQADVEGWF